MRRTVALVAAVLLLATAGCDQGGEQTVSSADGGPATSTTNAPSTTGSTAFGGGTSPISTPAGTPTTHLTGVRVGSHDGYDRVVFEFDERVPGHAVEYVERPVTEDGSGDEVAVGGDGVLQVRLENARSARIDGERVEPTYRGARRLTGDGEPVVEVVSVGDFEGVVTWVLGVEGRPPFRVTKLDGPPRLVIDVAAS